MGLQAKFQDQLDEDIKKHSDTIKNYFDSLKDAFVSQSPQDLIDSYKSHLTSILSARKKILKPITTLATQNNKQTQRATQATHSVQATAESSGLMCIYQCLLGSIEALIEHYFINGIYK